MPQSARSWMFAAAIAGTIYALIGITFALPSAHVHQWRLAAWTISAAVFIAHICHERFRLGSAPALAAAHIAAAVAFGAFGLAVSANVHRMHASSPHHHSPLLALSLLIWPLITALPAFCVALVGTWLLMRSSRQRK